MMMYLPIANRLIAWRCFLAREKIFSTKTILVDDYRRRTISNSGGGGGKSSKSSASSKIDPEKSEIESSKEVKIKELISTLKTEERRLLYQQLRMVLLKERFEAAAAAVLPSPTATGKQVGRESRWYRWRPDISRFTRYIDAPTIVQMRGLFTYHSLPYLAFGFLDNSIMILAGDYIESTLGVALQISTIASAALGNALADAISIATAYHVERFFTGLIGNDNEAATISLDQFELRQTRLIIQSARILGISCGCLLGMTPLLFLH